MIIFSISPVYSVYCEKFSHIGILRKNSHLSGFNILLDVIYVIILIKHLNFQLDFFCC